MHQGAFFFGACCPPPRKHAQSGSEVDRPEQNPVQRDGRAHTSRETFGRHGGRENTVTLTCPSARFCGMEKQILGVARLPSLRFFLNSPGFTVDVALLSVLFIESTMLSRRKEAHPVHTNVGTNLSTRCPFLQDKRDLFQVVKYMRGRQMGI